jgi:hypothetical protein
MVRFIEPFVSWAPQIEGDPATPKAARRTKKLRFIIEFAR